MKLEGVELRHIAVPLVAPFRTSFGTELDREVVLVRVVATDAEGWGECVAAAQPLYSSEYADGAADVLRRFLVPALLGLPEPETNIVLTELDASAIPRLAGLGVLALAPDGRRVRLVTHRGIDDRQIEEAATAVRSL